ncbi:hypothetical protein EIP91_000163 [Steccherinum ochraceum]|uniref:Uncharacterized protein n=1 Tax=Steccherinum ochraceum TaxID=92696 RepID=A0A4R0RQM5_9APHY|nr:hypothetical protein EIP91_000163 [Steccherinum ochraceum]
MSLRNTTVSHLSPSIQYTPGMLWFEGTNDTDSELCSYPEQSYHATNSSGGSGRAVFQWYGEGSMWVYGAYRQRLGPYNVTLDGQLETRPGYQAGDQEDLNSVLFSTSSLLPGKHQVELANAWQDPESVLDITSIVFQSALGEANTIEDSSSQCLWSTDDWQADSVSHTTFNSSGWMAMNFSGKYGVGIELWGATGPQNSPFSVTLDGWSARSFPSNTQVPPTSNTSQLLFFQYGLKDGQHTMLIRNDPAWSGLNEASTTLDIDRTVAFSQVGTTAVPTIDTHKTRNLAIIISTSVAVVLIIAVALIWYMRRRHAKIRRKNSLLRPSPFEVPLSPDSPEPEDMLEHGDFKLPPLTPGQRSFASSVVRALPMLNVGFLPGKLRKQRPRRKVDHSPSGSFDLIDSGPGTYKHRPVDSETPHAPYSVLANASSSHAVGLESPAPALARLPKDDVHRGHKHTRTVSTSSGTASIDSVSVLDPSIVFNISYAGSTIDSPLDPALPPNMRPLTISTAIVPPLVPNRRPASSKVASPEEAFAAVRANAEFEAPQPAGPKKRNRPLPIPKKIKIGLPLPFKREGTSSAPGSGKTPPTSSSQPPPYRMMDE